MVLRRVPHKNIAWLHLERGANSVKRIKVDARCPTST
jgi:hypothetical protein